MAWVLVLILTGSLLAGPVGTKPVSNPKLDFEKAMRLLDSGDSSGAEASLQKVLAQDARYVPALVAMAEIRARQGRRADAEGFFQKALVVDPSGAGLQRSYARFLITQGKLDAAVQALQKAARAGKSAPVQIELGEALLAQKKADLALAAFREASTLDPKSSAAQRGMGTALALLGKSAEAEAALSQAYSLAPDDPAVLFTFAMYYRERGNLAKSEDYLRKLVAVAPKHQGALVAWGDLLASRNDPAKAMEMYNRAIAVAPAAPIYIRIGMIQHQANKISEAEAAYRKAIELDPKAAEAQNNLAYLLLSQNRQLGEAEALARKATSLEPANAGFRDTLAMILKARGNVDAAILELEKAAQLKPENPEALYHLAMLYADKGKLPQARSLLSRALGINRTFTGADDAQRRLTALSR